MTQSTHLVEGVSKKCNIWEWGLEPPVTEEEIIEEQAIM
jgi:hypothetical protein